jgi:hypothetical protein
MDDLIENLRALNDDVKVPDAEVSLSGMLAKRNQPQREHVSYPAVRNTIVVAALIIFANISVMIGSAIKDSNTAKANDVGTYLQTYNLSIY